MDMREDLATLKVKSRITVSVGNDFDLRLPACRISRDFSKIGGNVQLLAGFQGSRLSTTLILLASLLGLTTKMKS